MLQFLKQTTSDLLHLLYPNNCVTCSNALIGYENILCSKCESELPHTNFWQHADNPMAQRFWGRVPLKGAAALYWFQKKDGVQQLIHQLKYKGKTDVGNYIGNKMAFALKSDNCIIPTPDLIIPVPLHWKKEKVRGYNQCSFIAQGIAEKTGWPVAYNVLERVLEKESQTKQKRFDRYGNVSNIFKLNSAVNLSDKHILLVDDVVTTGATAEACIQTLLQHPNIEVSFVAAAMAAR